VLWHWRLDAACNSTSRLQVYEGVYCLAQRQFERAAALFLDSVATFTAAELFDYETCIFYAVVAAFITLPRPELKKKARTR
jgi:26S proteasome regulatory subunit N7